MNRLTFLGYISFSCVRLSGWPPSREKSKLRFMRISSGRLALAVLLTFNSGSLLAAADFQFRHHFIDRTLPATESYVGDYGLTALVDLDRDGDLDFVVGGRPFQPSQLYTDICSKAWGPRAWNGAGGKMHVDFLENLRQRR